MSQANAVQALDDVLDEALDTALDARRRLANARAEVARADGYVNELLTAIATGEVAADAAHAEVEHNVQSIVRATEVIGAGGFSRR